jgi:hypothetical protein
MDVPWHSERSKKMSATKLSDPKQFKEWAEGELDRPLTYKELLKTKFPEAPPLVANHIIVRQGLTLLVGHPRTGKSLIATQLAICRALEQKWVGYDTVKGRTLYLDYEVGFRRLQRRLQIMSKAHNPVPDDDSLHFRSVLGEDVYINKDSGKQRVERYIEEAKPDLLILDPLYKFHSGTEVDQASIEAFLKTLDTWRPRYKMAVLLVHHYRKPRRDQNTGAIFKPNLYDVSGHGAIIRAPDSTIGISGEPHDTKVDLMFDLRHGETPPLLRVERDAETLWYESMGRAVPDHLIACMEVLREKPLANAEWAKRYIESGVVKGTGYRHINEVKKLGFAVETKEGSNVWMPAADILKRLASPVS